MSAEDNIPETRTALRDNLEWIAILVVMVVVIRQMVVEAFKIPTGSMAPTLLGVHKEVRCPNCGWVFDVGHDKLRDGMAQCPNCLDVWSGASGVCGTAGEGIRFRRPAWLWHEGYCAATRRKVTGTDAANRVNRWGSRILVNKFIYRIRKPRRWEVVVFLYPYHQVRCSSCPWRGTARSIEGFECPDCGSRKFEAAGKNYIKRLVGLPGEKIVIQNGDLYVDSKLARKPAAVQKHLWQHVFDSRFVPRREVARGWDFGAAEHLWQHDPLDGSLALNALGSEKSIEATFARRIKDLCPYNGGDRPSPGLEAESGRHEVGDRRIEALVTVQSSRRAPLSAVVLRIVEDEHDFAFCVPVGEDRKALLTDSGRSVQACTVDGLRPGEKTRLVLENYDDLVVAKLRGKTILSYAYEGNPTPRPGRKRVAFGARGARVLFHRINIQRDIYYRIKSQGDNYYVASDDSLGRPPAYELDDESYFVLGDNSPQSSDSREWPDPRVPQDNVLGLAFAVFWPIHNIELLSRPW